MMRTGRRSSFSRSVLSRLKIFSVRFQTNQSLKTAYFLHSHLVLSLRNLQLLLRFRNPFLSVSETLCQEFDKLIHSWLLICLTLSFHLLQCNELEG